MTAGLLDPESRVALRRMRQRAAEEGYELTEDQLIETIVETDRKLKEAAGIGLVEVRAIRALTSIPAPPYAGYFDELREAETFKAQAEEQYPGVILVIEKRGKYYHIVEEP